MMKYEWAYCTDQGAGRSNNQDSLLLKKALLWGEEAVLAVLCDGMGGLKKGELASASAVRAFSRWFEEDFPGLGLKNLREQAVFSSWETLLQRLNGQIGAYGQRQRLMLGTTVTAVLFLKGRYCTVHVGDCRLYEITDRIRQLTKDQTLLQREVDQGFVTFEEAKRDGKDHVLLQCVGASKELEPVYGTGRVPPDALYLLCCDGFWRRISSREIFWLLADEKVKSPVVLHRRLRGIISQNRKRGEQDNISAAGILCGGSGAGDA